MLLIVLKSCFLLHYVSMLLMVLFKALWMTVLLKCAIQIYMPCPVFVIRGISFHEAFSSIAPVTEQPQSIVTPKPTEESDACIGLSPSFLNKSLGSSRQFCVFHENSLLFIKWIENWIENIVKTLTRLEIMIHIWSINFVLQTSSSKEGQLYSLYHQHNCFQLC